MGADSRPMIESVHPLAERCDGCSARAQYSVELSNGGQLYLCGHHTKRNLDTLSSSGAQVTQLEFFD